MTSFLRRLIRTIKQSKYICVATHFDPDCDGICSSLLMANLINFYTGVKPKLFCASLIPGKYQFLLKGYRFGQTLGKCDLIVAVDSAGIDRIFPADEFNHKELGSSKIIVNIDHHKSNRQFGDIAIIDEKASSACEIIYRLYRKLNLAIDKHHAEIFYAGIYNETGGFVYPNTTTSALKICAELIAIGINPAELVKKLNIKTIAGTKLLSDVLGTISIKNSVGSMYLDQKMLRKHHALMSESENFISFLQAIQGVRISAFFREEEGEIRISLRSDGILDVNDFARKYGGGGHRLAAGIRIKGNINDVMRRIIADLDRKMANAGHK